MSSSVSFTSQTITRRTAESGLQLIDLASAVIDQIVIALHGILKFLQLHRFARLLRIFLETRHIDFGDDGPITLGAHVRHDAHWAEPPLLDQLRQRDKLLNHWSNLTRLAVHDVSNDKHGSSCCDDVKLQFYARAVATFVISENVSVLSFV